MKNEKALNASAFFGTPMGNRTPDSAVRGRRLNRLTMRAFRIFDIQAHLCNADITTVVGFSQLI